MGHTSLDADVGARGRAVLCTLAVIYTVLSGRVQRNSTSSGDSTGTRPWGTLEYSLAPTTSCDVMEPSWLCEGRHRYSKFSGCENTPGCAYLPGARIMGAQMSAVLCASEWVRQFGRLLLLLWWVFRERETDLVLEHRVPLTLLLGLVLLLVILERGVFLLLLLALRRETLRRQVLLGLLDVAAIRT
jgi:hypothetical protein